SDAGAFADRRAAADCTQRFLIRMLRSNAYFKRNQGYLTVLNRLAMDRARGLLAAGDVAGAVREAEAALAALPGCGEPTESTGPRPWTRSSGAWRWSRRASTTRSGGSGSRPAIATRRCRRHGDVVRCDGGSRMASVNRKATDDEMTHAMQVIREAFPEFEPVF